MREEESEQKRRERERQNERDEYVIIIESVDSTCRDEPDSSQIPPTLQIVIHTSVIHTVLKNG